MDDILEEELNDLIEKIIDYTKYAGGNFVETAIDAIRQAKSQFERDDEVLESLSSKDFGSLNGVRDFFIDGFTYFKRAGVTHEWMVDFMNTFNKNIDVLEVGKYRSFLDLSTQLSKTFSSRIYGISPKRNIGGGEYLMRLIFSSVGKVDSPKTITDGVRGDLSLNGKVYEIKGNLGRLDGANLNDIMDIIKKYPEFNDNPKRLRFYSTQYPDFVKDVLRCYFNGENPYTMVFVNEDGYVIIDEKLEWEGIDLGVYMPVWIKKKSFDRSLNLSYNDNDRTVKLVVKRMKQVPTERYIQMELF